MRRLAGGRTRVTRRLPTGTHWPPGVGSAGDFEREAAMEARRQFLGGVSALEAAIPAEILRSWQRSVAKGLDMASQPAINVLTSPMLREAQERNEALVRAARGEMEALFQDASLTPGIVILTDPTGVVLYSAGTGEFADRAASVALRPGALWDEGTIGTNGIGTALAERRPISVIGRQHFFDVHSVLSCSAAPIFDARGVIVGVLDLTNPSDVPQTHTLALVRRAVEQIEHRLFEGQFCGYERMSFHSDPYLIGSVHEGLLAFDGDRLIGANRHGLGLLRLDWPALGASRFSELFMVDPGSVNPNPSSDDFVVQTKTGQTLFARMQAPQRVHRVRAVVEDAGDAHKQQSPPDLCKIVDRLLKGPSARQIVVRRLKAGQLIYGADEEPALKEGLLVVRSGRLRCFASFEGKELTLFTLDAGDAIPLHAGSMFEIKKEAEIATISLASFRRLTQSDPDLAVSAMPVIDRMLQKSLRMNEDMVFRGVKHRLVRALCDAAGRDGRAAEHGIVLDMPPNAEDFAMQIGATRQSVSSVMAELIRSGVVRRHGAAIVVADLNRLKQELD
jgi:CRP-like cAMP-binding protein